MQARQQHAQLAPEGVRVLHNREHSCHQLERPLHCQPEDLRAAGCVAQGSCLQVAGVRAGVVRGRDTPAEAVGVGGQ